MKRSRSSERSGSESGDEPTNGVKSSRLDQPEGAGSSHVACQALFIVLQTWMVPNLGWYLDVFDGRLPSLREDIVYEYVSFGLLPRGIADDAGCQTEEERNEIMSPTKLMNNLETIKHMALLWDAERRSVEIFAIDGFDRFRPEETVPDEEVQQVLPMYVEDDYNFSRPHYRSEDFFKIVQAIFRRYWYPISCAKQHQAISILYEVIDVYLSLHQAITSWFQKQQEKFSFRTSFIAYQVSSWLKWKDMAKSIESVIFSIALYALLLEHDREKHTSIDWVSNTMLHCDELYADSDPSRQPFIDTDNFNLLISDTISYLQATLNFVVTDDNKDSLLNIANDMMNDMKTMAFHIYQLTTSNITSVRQRQHHLHKLSFPIMMPSNLPPSVILQQTIYDQAKEAFQTSIKLFKGKYWDRLFLQRQLVSSSWLVDDDRQVSFRGKSLYLSNDSKRNNEIVMNHSYYVDLSLMHQSIHRRLILARQSNQQSRFAMMFNASSDSSQKHTMYQSIYKGLVDLMDLKDKIYGNSIDDAIIEEGDNDVDYDFTNQLILCDRVIHRTWQVFAQQKYWLDHPYDSYKKKYGNNNGFMMNMYQTSNLNINNSNSSTIDISCLKDGIIVFQRDFIEDCEIYQNLAMLLLQVKHHRRKRQSRSTPRHTRDNDEDDNDEDDDDDDSEVEPFYERPYITVLTEYVKMLEDSLQLKERLIENITTYKQSAPLHAKTDKVTTFLYHRPMLGYFNYSILNVEVDSFKSQDGDEKNDEFDDDDDEEESQNGGNQSKNPPLTSHNEHLLFLIRLQDGLSILYHTALSHIHVKQGVLYDIKIESQAEDVLSKMNSLSRLLYEKAICAMKDAMRYFEDNSTVATDDNGKIRDDVREVIHINELVARCYVALAYSLHRIETIEDDDKLYDQINVKMEAIEYSRNAWFSSHGNVNSMSNDEITRLSMNLHYLQLLTVLVEVDETYLSAEHKYLREVATNPNAPQYAIQQARSNINQRRRVANKNLTLLQNARNLWSYGTKVIGSLKEFTSNRFTIESNHSWCYFEEYVYWITRSLQAVVFRMDVLQFADQRLIDSAELGYDNDGQIGSKFKAFDYLNTTFLSFLNYGNMKDWSEKEWIEFILSNKHLDEHQQDVLGQFGPASHAKAEAALNKVAYDWEKNFECMEYFIHMRDRDFLNSSGSRSLVSNPPTVFTV